MTEIFKNQKALVLRGSDLGVKYHVVSRVSG